MSDADLRTRAATNSSRDTTSWIAFAAATLLGAFLVFQVQPVISKCVLPWFGGTPAVWTTCLLFFQVLLFGGYLYAHCLRRFATPALQGIVHLALLLLAANVLPIQPSDAWKPIGSEDPTWTLLWLLTAHVALPYFVLSSTGPLVQAWLSYENEDQSVYRLYALSNAGSLVALLSYPFVVEPWLSVSQQSSVWSLAFCAFVIVDGWLAVRLITRRRRGNESSKSEVSAATVSSPTWASRLLWVSGPALASVMLLVITSHVCQDVAVIPFLWVLPLSLYLLSFIICFDSPRWYRPKLIAVATALGFLAIQTREFLPGALRLPVEVSAYLLVLLGVCLLCHGEVARWKPSTKWLTQYYALISLGGAMGGITVALICPLIFHDYRELPIAMAISMGIVVVTFLAARSWMATDCNWHLSKRFVGFVGGLVVVTSAATLLSQRADTIDQRRNFFGVLRVEQDERRVQLVHGNTIHGVQIRGEERRTPTSYYGTQSGVGRVLGVLQLESRDLKIGVVGLGCGVLATYGRPTDEFDMFEINPDVLAIAKEHFSFLGECRSTVRHHLGDGRLLLERERQTRFDLLVLDAFSSDAIPAHLLTVEAMQLYHSRLREGGVLAIHLSNNHLDLVPLANRLCQSVGLDSREIQSEGVDDTFTKPARWVIATERDESFWQAKALSPAKRCSKASLESAPLWTDQHHNLASVLNWSI